MVVAEGRSEVGYRDAEIMVINKDAAAFFSENVRQELSVSEMFMHLHISLIAIFYQEKRQIFLNSLCDAIRNINENVCLHINDQEDISLNYTSK